MTNRTTRTPSTALLTSEDFGRTWTPNNQIFGALKDLTGRTPDFTIRRFTEMAASGRAGPMTLRNGKWGTLDVPGVAVALGMMPASGNAPTQRAPARDNSLVAA